MTTGELTILVDDLFFLSKSHLVLEALLPSLKNKVIAEGDFILAVIDDYRYLYAVKFSRVLAILVILDCILFKYLYNISVLSTTIR